MTDREQQTMETPEVSDVGGRQSSEMNLRERERALRTFYETTSSVDLAFEEKVERLLELGCERFGLEIGFLARIADGQLEVLDARGSHDLLQSGATAPLSQTYCRHTIDAELPVGIIDAPAEDWADDPAYERYGLDSYLGVTVTVGGERYGTLCFADTEPREMPFGDDEKTFLELMGSWIESELERERREERLAALTELTQDLTDTDDRTEISALTVERAPDLRLPVTALARYDDDSGELRPVARTPDAIDFPVEELCESGTGTGWNALVEDTPLVTHLDGSHPDEVAAVPLGEHGVLLTAATGGEFRETDLDFVRAVAFGVEAALDRAERVELLEKREVELADRNESLERLNRINTTIRNIDRALVEASSRAEITEVVCEQLASVGPYRLAWVGELDGPTGEVVPTAWAGDDDGYFDAVTITADDSPTGRGPSGRAIRTREPQVVDSVFKDPCFEPWRREALARNYRSVISLPLTYEGSFYGVLTVYAGGVGEFDGLERSVLTQLSATIAYAINSVESKKALVTDSVTELDFEIRDESLEILGFCAEYDCSYEFETAVRQSDGTLRTFFSTRGADPDRVVGFAPGKTVTDITHLSTLDGEESLFEGILTEQSLNATILAHGGVPVVIKAEEGVAKVSVELPADGDIRSFVEMFESRYDAVELVAQRERERSEQTRNEFRAAFEGELTDRQREVLKTAHFSGYFESPRRRTGREVGDSLGVSQPTFNHHLRTAQRKLFDLLFDPHSPDV